MKKYFILSTISNIILALLTFYGLLNYIALSASNSLSSTIDLLVLIGIVVIDILVNYLIFRYLKIKERKIFILIPSSLFLLITGILFLFIK